MRALRSILLILITSLNISCHATPKAPPTQVVYRFDDHRYLELVGFNCEGGLWFTDTKLGIHSQIEEQFYRIFTKKYMHPSERYISVTMYEGAGFYISKDYGRTWGMARYAPGGGSVKYGASNPEREEIESFTVVNDQGFMLTKNGDLYMSSKPFNDPRLEPGGSGIDYTVTTKRGIRETYHMRPGYGGGSWGTEYSSWNSFAGPKHWTTDAYRTNFQNIPNNVPEVKNHTGWDHMRCDPDAGK